MSCGLRLKCSGRVIVQNKSEVSPTLQPANKESFDEGDPLGQDIDALQRS